MASNSILERQNQLRLRNIGCDVIFKIGAKSFPAHRAMLMARMEHFENMFTADMREKKELTVQFDPLIIDPNFFGDVLNYVYTSKIDFTLENLRPIFKAADYFCFDELTNKVKEFMLSTMKVENALLYRNIIVEFDLKSFRDQCEEFIIDNLSSDMIKSQLIPILSFEELRGFTDKLKEKSKFEDMFHYSIDWILNDKANRIEMLFELLKNIPLESLSLRFIKQTVSKQEVVMKDMDCLTLLFNSVISISLDSSESPVERLYAIGGKYSEELSSVSEYNSAKREWTATTPMPSKRSHFGCAVIDHRIYVCGGNNGQNTNELTVFDTYTRTWTQLTPMKRIKTLCASAALDGHIYVAGGWNGALRLAMVERYDVRTDKWQDVAPMNVFRSSLELVALNGFLYAIGGYNGSDNLKIVERYDPTTNQWTLINRLNNKYGSFGSAVLNGNIYIVGTYTCEVYSPADDKWTEMPAPSRCEYGRRLAVYNGKLYAIGGIGVNWASWISRKTVEVFDFQSRVWQQEPDMDVPRTHHQLAVVKSQKF